MRLAVSFSSLLVSLLCASTIVDARPLEGNAGMVTLPLRSLRNQKETLEVHPQIYFQQHVNRAHRRLARMTGRQVPSDAELRDNLVKRAIAIEASGGQTGLAKRYWTNGVMEDKLAKLRAASASSKSSARSVAKRGSSKSQSARRRGGLVRRQDDSDDSDGDDSEDDGGDSEDDGGDSEDDGGDSEDGGDDGDDGDDDGEDDGEDGEDDGDDSASVDGGDIGDDGDDSASVDGNDGDDGDEGDDGDDSASVDGGNDADDGDSDGDDSASVDGDDSASVDGDDSASVDGDDGDESDSGDGNDIGSTSSNSTISQNGSGNSTAAGNGGGNTASSNGNGGNSNSTGDGATSNTTSSTGNSGTDLGGPGFNQVDLNAALNPGLTDANTPTDSDSLGLDIEANDVGYIATVQLGTPPQNFKILMDSGSADFWVGAENCQTEASSSDSSSSGSDSSGQDLFARAKGKGGGATSNTCGNHVFLGKQSSSTFVDTGKNFEVTYGTGDVKGDVITDNVEIAGLKLNKHSFGVATQESDDFSSNTTPFDGLMGLALSSLSEQGVPTPPESLAAANLIKAPITSFKISRLQDQKNDGEITFGGLDSSKFDANTLVTFDNVNQQGFWEGPLQISIDGNNIGLSSATTAILDTGTSLIVAPQSDAETFHNAIPGAKDAGQGSFTIPCTSTVAVTMTIGGGQFAINPQDLLFLPVDQNNPTGDCISAVSAGQVGGADEWLLGDAFLKNAYFSVDVSTNKISLATLV